MNPDKKKLLEAIENISQLQKEIAELYEKDIRFVEWVADNMELGIAKESKHYLHLENRIIEITLADALKVFNGEITL